MVNKMNLLGNNVQKKGQKIAEMIVSFNNEVFNNDQKAIHIIPLDSNENWENFKGIAAYIPAVDEYLVVLKNIHQITIDSDAALIGLAGHEVRHRVQYQYPEKIISKEYLLRNEIITQDSFEFVKTIYKNQSETLLGYELDAMVIEELIRKIFYNIVFKDGIVENTKLILCKKLLLSSENNFLEIYNKIHI